MTYSRQYQSYVTDFLSQYPPGSIPALHPPPHEKIKNIALIYGKVLIHISHKFSSENNYAIWKSKFEHAFLVVLAWRECEYRTYDQWSLRRLCK